MTLDEFWNLIEEAKRSTAKTSEIPNWLVNRLSQFSENEIVDFGSHFQDCRHQSDDGCLWLAAIIMMRGCSDDSFDYFRGWLIAQGRKAFEAALVDPDSLSQLENFDGQYKGVPELEEMLSVDILAYEKRIGSTDTQGSDGYEALKPNKKYSGTRNRDMLRISGGDRAMLLPKLVARFARD